MIQNILRSESIINIDMVATDLHEMQGIFGRYATIESLPAIVEHKIDIVTVIAIRPIFVWYNKLS